MIAHLAGMEMANASMYDGRRHWVNLPLWHLFTQKRRGCSSQKAYIPEYRQVLQTYMAGRNIEILEIEINEGVWILQICKQNSMTRPPE